MQRMRFRWSIPFALVAALAVSSGLSSAQAVTEKCAECHGLVAAALAEAAFAPDAAPADTAPLLLGTLPGYTVSPDAAVTLALAPAATFNEAAAYPDVVHMAPQSYAVLTPLALPAATNYVDMLGTNTFVAPSTYALAPLALAPVAYALAPDATATYAAVSPGLSLGPPDEPKPCMPCRCGERCSL